MSPSRPFLDGTDQIDTAQLLAEAIPLAKLVGVFGLVAAIPFSLSALLYGPLGIVFTLLAQFVVAVGTGIVLIYVIVRAIDIAEK